MVQCLAAQGNQCVVVSLFVEFRFTVIVWKIGYLCRELRYEKIEIWVNLLIKSVRRMFYNWQ